MTDFDITDPLFNSAVQAIYDGNILLLQKILEANPELVRMRLDNPTDGYFQHPYLIWFVADNPIRNGRLPANIIEITSLLIKFARQYAKESFQQQIDYTYGLVETGRIPRECGVQIGLIDVLIDNGVTPGNAHGALANGNIEAAKHIIRKTGKISLTAAVALSRMDDVEILLPKATIEDKQVALMVAAFYGKPDIISLMIKSGVDVNAYIKSGFHSHASPLHQAVYSGSLEAVKILVQAGADRDAIDKVYNGTPLGWAIYMQTEENDEMTKRKYREIENYLLVQAGN
jgi:peptide-methionine (S)-S-oxide reductase